MKKWENATLEVLEINATAGGPNKNTTQDGETWWDENNNRWNIPVGDEDKIS